ncbi:MAG: histidinol-phosphate transaminase [Candidatus Bathyarchaeia archaeon]
MNIRYFIEASKELKPYKPGYESKGVAKEGVKEKGYLKLNANENLFIPEGLIKEIILDVVNKTDARLYPSSERELLENSIADYLEVEHDQVIIGSGGDQIIELIMNSYLKPGDSMIAATPTFSMYPRAAKQRGVKWIGIDIDKSFNLRKERILSAIETDSKLLVICNPNNPTANQFDKERIISIAEAFSGLVLVDEAYAEYGEYSLVGEVDDFENLMILRTFSKAFGMAGMRLGYAITNTELAKVLNEKYKTPYPVSSVTLGTGIEVLERREDILIYVDDVKRVREDLVDGLNELELASAFPSSTNFVLFTTKKSHERVYHDLLERGILVRKIGSVPGCTETLRVTVPPTPMCERFLQNLGEVLGEMQR